MRINTNVAALNSYNQLKNTQNNLSKSLSRLSSGKRINGAADDAAGLAISEKMNAQTRGLAQAQRNAQDGISMIQTAEGALKETHSILQRMRELAVQSSNDTLTTEDRNEIQKEINQLTEEVQRIGVTTEFNTQQLLDSSFTGKKIHIGANKDQTLDVDVSDMRAVEVSTGGTVDAAKGLAIGEIGGAVTATIDGATGVTVNEISLQYTDDTGTMQTATGHSISVISQVDAEAAIDTFQSAIDDVSTERSKLGALQNRLDHTINNLNTAEENLTAAESRISDVDMAKEMMSFTKNQILSQAGTAMMAQANQLPQGVLQLLG
ncbi:flagellin [Halanaerobium saccharolyticum]|uniref:Flagellin n=1 Tax=Halanaerobium saccharolyticum TaxID=43595 RepID=A0A2T5RHV0_9FIRM|nr:flagellin [Halanaerobium saccharolyticum]PTV96838.1 flagellin [Halanaerobium saccharolyticum]